MAASWDGPPAMLVIFKRMFGSFSASNIIKQNDFSNLQNYFLQCSIPLAMGGLRNAHGICPPEVLGFLLDLFKYNDNSLNTLSYSYYRARLVDETVSLVVSMLQVRGRRVRVCGSNVYYLSIQNDGRDHQVPQHGEDCSPSTQPRDIQR